MLGVTLETGCFYPRASQKTVTGAFWLTGFDQFDALPIWVENKADGFSATGQRVRLARQRAARWRLALIVEADELQVRTRLIGVQHSAA